MNWNASSTIRQNDERIQCGADYKGEFMLSDRRYCYPLTITDFASRYLLGCEALSTNGRHERMHLTLKKEATRPAARNYLQQQARFDDYLEEFNQDRPHSELRV